jgi:hypothetical protein
LEGCRRGPVGSTALPTYPVRVPTPSKTRGPIGHISGQAKGCPISRASVRPPDHARPQTRQATGQSRSTSLWNAAGPVSPLPRAVLESGKKVIFSQDERTGLFLMRMDCDWCSASSAFIREAKVKRSQAGARDRFTTISLEQAHPSKTPRELPDDAPEAVREVFAEAALAEAAGAARLAGIGYRAAVEQIVKDKGTTGKNLYERITGLTAVGGTQEIVDAFHEARFVGNDAAHDGLAYSSDEIADIAELVIEAVTVLYVQPAQRARMAQQRAARRAAAKKVAPPAP